MTPRELFYSTPPPAAAKAAQPAKQKKKPTQIQAAKIEKEKEEPASHVEIVAARPLGLRYSVLKYSADGSAEETDVESAFHTGDLIRLRLRVNEPGYLYVAHKGSSGAWRVLFPSEELDGGSNAVYPGRDYDLPGRTRLMFDETPGEERIFLILSRQPEKQLDRIIYDLDRAPQTRPAEPDRSQTLIAQAQIPDPAVGSLRMAARDLVFEKVDSSRPAPAHAGGRRETAVYVVNASGARDARLVADITLNHR